MTGQKVWTWFALDEQRPLFAFAGIWCRWPGTRGTQKNPVEGEHTLFGFLTTAPNEVVRPVHAKAMPVLLTTAAECDAWLEAPTPEALKLQRPLPDDQLRIVARGERETRRRTKRRSCPSPPASRRHEFGRSWPRFNSKENGAWRRSSYRPAKDVLSRCRWAPGSG